MCHALDVSSSAPYDKYSYAWKKRKDAPPTPREQAQQKRRDLVEELFSKSHKVYGYRKTFNVLRARGVACSANTIHADYKERGMVLFLNYSKTNFGNPSLVK